MDVKGSFFSHPEVRWGLYILGERRDFQLNSLQIVPPVESLCEFLV